MYMYIGVLAWHLPGISEISQAKGDIDWPQHYAALLAYEKEYGHCNVSKADSYTCILYGLGEGGSDLEYSGNLGLWLANQRSMKNGTRGNTLQIVDREVLLQQLVDRGMYTYLLLVT